MTRPSDSTRPPDSNSTPPWIDADASTRASGANSTISPNSNPEKSTETITQPKFGPDRRPEPQWLELTLRAHPEDVDPVVDVLRDFAPDGVSIEPAIRTLDHDNFAYEYLDEPSLLRACIPAPFSEAQRRALRRRLASLQLNRPLGRLHYAPVTTNDWSEEWKRYFHVLRVGRIVVRPSWEPFDPAPDDIVIDLDPGKAFGTGQHETTRLCLAALEAHLKPGMHVLDVGTGSGILAIAAARLGAASVRACDIDSETLEVARANFARNDAHSIALATGSLGADWSWPEPAAGSADLLVANISSNAVIALVPAAAEALRAGGIYIASGFIANAQSRVEAAARAAGLEPFATTEDGEWRCLVATKKGGA
jgi:ribosomal protein L11 methyltransferase